MINKKTVLLIEDDPTLSELTGEMIKMFGYEVLQSASMNDSIDTFDNNKEKIGLVIFDMNLEETTGPEVLQELKKIDDNFIPVLASGMTIDSDKDEYLEMGFKEVIAKPYSMMTLKKVLNEYLG